MNGKKQAMDVSLFEKENQKKSNSMEKQDVSKKMDGIWKIIRFEEGNIKKAHKTSWAEKDKAKCHNGAMSI